MKFSYGSDKPKIKPEGKGVWIEFNDWIKFALCETAAIEGENIEQYLGAIPQKQLTSRPSYSTAPAPSYTPTVTPSYAQPAATPSYAQPSPAAQGKTTKFCTKCGSEIDANSAFCGECGSKLEH